MAPNPPAGRFPMTHWSRIVRAAAPAAPGAREALAALCTAYWYPLYTFIHRHGHPQEAAADLTQDYFARLLERGVRGAADRSKGRFRVFLRTDCGFFLSHRRERDRARKRGGGIATLSIDARDAEGRYLREPADDLTPERLFDRSWALTLLDRVLEQLAREYADSGRGALFEGLQFVLTDGPRSVPYAAVAAQLGTTETAIQSAVRRLRRRYRTILRGQIGVTLDEPTQPAIDDEIRALFAALE